jgi:6-methylsalicylate decarboxylase
MVSVSRPGVYLRGVRDARAMSRYVNDFAADLKAAHPGRFGFFATVPFPDIDACIDEAARSHDTLGASGVVLLTNTQGQYVGDPVYDPLLEELDRRGSVLFVHPTHPDGQWVDGVPPFVIDFLLDTTRAATIMMRNRIIQRFPRLRIILSHAGGFVPYAAERIARLLPRDAAAPADSEQRLADLTSFYFDTALSGAGAGMATLREFANPERILFGTDFPYAPGDASVYFGTHLNISEPDVQARIGRDNAAALFPEFAGDATRRLDPVMLPTEE